MSKLINSLKFCACVVAFNVTPYVIAHLFFIGRPLINIDYLIFMGLIHFIPTNILIKTLMTGMLFIFELIDNFSLFYGINSSALALQNIQLNTEIPWKPLLIFICSLIFVALINNLIVRRINNFKFNLKEVIISIMALIAVDVASGTNSFFGIKPPIDHGMRVDIAYSALYRFYNSIKINEIRGRSFYVGLAKVNALSLYKDNYYLNQDVATNGRLGENNLVIINVESLALGEINEVNEYILSPIMENRSAAAKMYIGYATGATIHGELRELCASGLTSHVKIGEDVCLPALFEELFPKSERIYMHGYSSRFYNRAAWISQMGFNRQLFLEDLRGKEGMHICGAYLKGICDSSMLKLLENKISTNTKSLLYILTLETHYPIVSNFSLPRSSKLLEAQSDNLTLLASSHRALLEEISGIIKKFPNNDYIIFGDHPYPFDSEADRRLFKNRAVPIIYVQGWTGK